MFGTLLSTMAFVVAAGPPAELTDQTYTQWREHIRPKTKELCFCTIPWRTTLWDAVTEAQKLEKAIGTRWGATQNNSRRGDLGEGPMGVLFTLAGDGPSERVAPAFHYHRIYRAVVPGRE